MKPRRPSWSVRPWDNLLSKVGLRDGGQARPKVEGLLY